MASASTVSEPKELAQRRKSSDTVCSSNSSCFLHKRKPIHPLANSIRTFVSKSSTNNAVKQRVLSARLLKMRSLQNQLNDANFHLAELQQENRALRNLQTRQDKALTKYEGTNADLPKLLKSHEEETRMLAAKNKTLRKSLKDVSDQLKMKEDELTSARDQLKNLVALTKHKNLGERHALAEQVEDLKEKLKCSDDKINLLNRKIQLETKNYKYKLNSEMVKNKQAQKELLHALAEIDRLTTLFETKSRFVSPNNRKRFSNVNQRQSVSLIALSSEETATNKEPSKLKKLSEEPKVVFDLEPKVIFELEPKLLSSNSSNRIISSEDDTDNQSDYSNVKLEPITNDNDAKNVPASSLMVSPTESIKARLSASVSTKNRDMEQLNKSLERLNMFESGLTEPTHSITIIKQKSRPTSSHKLEKISSSNNLEALLQKPANTKGQDEIEQRLGSVCNQMLSTVKDCSSVVDTHLLDYQTAKNETEKLLQSLRETDSMNSKLRHSKFLAKETFEIPEKDLDLANQIWNDEYAFRKDMNCSKENAKEYESFIKSDRNGNVIKKEVEVAPEDKTKLLATLRAIDNGEDIEEIKYNSDISNRKNKLVEELFADLHK